MNIGYRISNIECRNSNFASRRFAFTAVLLCSCALMHFVTGCESTGSKKTLLAEQVETLTQDKRQLTRQIEQLKSKNKELQKQINTLHGLADEVKLENLYDVQRIKITRYTNLYDKNKDGKKDTLNVYIQPIDRDGDIVKAAASVHVQLLDLNKDQGPEVLAEWHVTPGQLRKLWFAALMMTNYRLTFDVSDKVESFEEPLTVKVTFTDYLTGKVFKEQKVIKPR